jgi:hypothetical protein
MKSVQDTEGKKLKSTDPIKQCRSLIAIEEESQTSLVSSIAKEFVHSVKRKTAKQFN